MVSTIISSSLFKNDCLIDIVLACATHNIKLLNIGHECFQHGRGRGILKSSYPLNSLIIHRRKRQTLMASSRRLQMVHRHWLN